MPHPLAQSTRPTPANGAPGHVLVPYGGFLAGRLQAGETVLVNGATGDFGSAGVAVGPGHGRGCVIATGRNEKVLADFERRFGARFRTVQITGNEETDRRQMQPAAAGPIDCVLDILPPAANASGRAPPSWRYGPMDGSILMGGIAAPRELPYAWIMRNCITIHGLWMFRATPPRAWWGSSAQA